jgi:hypothetical protein
MSGQWPPEWEDSDTGLPDEWTEDNDGLDPEASEVTLFLASVPSPVLPASFEARIGAAIAAEATARANGTAPAHAASAGTASASTASTNAVSASAGIAAAETDDAKATDRSSPPESSPDGAGSGSASAAKHRRRRTSAASRGAAAGSRPAGSRPGGRRRRFRMPNPAVSASLVIILFVVGFAVVASLGGPSSSSSAPESGLSNTGAPSAAGGSSSSSFAGPSRDGSEPDYETNRPVNFVVTESGTSYQRATLASQVREQLAAVTPSAATHTASSVPNSASPAATAESSASASSPPRTAPSARLQGCVSRVTHGVTPSLVEEGSYDGIPAYIIAVPSHAWAVRLGCTAADPEQITSVSLTGLFRESQRPRIG